MHLRSIAGNKALRAWCETGLSDFTENAQILRRSNHCKINIQIYAPKTKTRNFALKVLFTNDLLAPMLGHNNIQYKDKLFSCVDIFI